MGIVEEYLKKDAYYKKKYGEKTFLLYHVGSFYEVYGVENHHSYENIKRYSEYLGLALGYKKQHNGHLCIYNNKVLMTGFKDILLEKYIEKIHPFGYSVVVYIQKDKPGCKEKDRVFYNVYSPGTTFIENNQILSNNISCIWVQKLNTISGQKYIFGLSNINVFNGTSNLCEYYENYYHNPTTYDAIEKFLNVYNPIEVIMIHNLESQIFENILQSVKM